MFDQVFGSDSTQDQMFRSVVSGLVDRFIDGKCACPDSNFSHMISDATPTCSFIGYNSILVTQVKLRILSSNDDDDDSNH